MSVAIIRNEASTAKPAKKISQKEIRKYLKLKAQVEKMATHFFNSLKAGAEVEKGTGKAYLDRGFERRVNWREALLKECGQAKVDSVRRGTKRKRFCRLRVEKKEK